MNKHRILLSLKGNNLENFSEGKFAPLEQKNLNGK